MKTRMNRSEYRRRLQGLRQTLGREQLFVKKADGTARLRMRDVV